MSKETKKKGIVIVAPCTHRLWESARNWRSVFIIIPALEAQDQGWSKTKEGNPEAKATALIFLSWTNMYDSHAVCKEDGALKTWPWEAFLLPWISTHSCFPKFRDVAARLLVLRSWQKDFRPFYCNAQGPGFPRALVPRTEGQEGARRPRTAEEGLEGSASPRALPLTCPLTVEAP